MIPNTGPLIALAGIGRLDLIRAICSRCVVPGSVHREILEGGLSRTGKSNYREAVWLEKAIPRKPPDPGLKSLLHEGEAQVIALALDLEADIVLIDERKARKIARDVFGLQVIGSIRVLLEAKRHGMIPSVGEILEQIRANGYWYSDEIVSFALKAAGE